MLFLNNPYLKAILGLAALRSLLNSPAASNSRKAALPSFVGVAEVRSFIPGRMRLFIPSLKHNTKQCQHLDDNLSRVQSISEHRVNPVCGTVLIHYNQAAVDPAILLGAVIKLLGLEQAAENPKSRIGKELALFMKSINSALIEKTNGLLDLESALSLLLVGVGSYKTITGRSATPGSITYLWWAHTLLTRRQ